MAMRAMNAITSPLPFRVHTAAAEVGSPQLKHSFQHRALNPLSLIGSHEGRPGILNVRRGDNRNFSVAVRAAGTAEATTSGAATEISLEELKKRGDSYFLTDTRPVILFDGVCNFCNGGVNFMLDNDTEGHGSTGMDVKHLAAVKFDRKTRFAALQSEAGRALLVRSGRAPDDLSSIVLVDKDRSYIKSEAILRIGQFLKFPYPPAAFAGFIFPMFFRDAVYETVANNRYSIYGTTASCRLSDPRFAERYRIWQLRNRSKEANHVDECRMIVPSVSVWVMAVRPTPQLQELCLNLNLMKGQYMEWQIDKSRASRRPYFLDCVAQLDMILDTELKRLLLSVKLILFWMEQ